MPLPIESVTTAVLSAALDAASRRHALTAANIANASTEDHVPLRLSFDAQLADARTLVEQRAWIDEAALEQLRGMRDVAAQPASSGPVTLDQEMTELARNAVQFQALLQGVSRHLSLMGLAAADGRK